jgi:ABC-type transport system substrate-binding protein
MPEVSEDGLTYTIRLKQGVRFADDPCFPGGRGRELRASDVVFSFLRLMDARLESKGAWIFEGRIVGLDEFHEATKTATKDPARTDYSPAAGFPAVPGLVAVDDHTLRIVLTAPYPQLVWTFAMTYGSVYPPEAVARYGVEFMLHPVGTGPYLVGEYSSAQKLVLVRNPNYRKDPYPPPGAPGDAEVRGRLDDAGRRCRSTTAWS